MPPAFLFDLDQTLIDRSQSLSEFLPMQYLRFAAADQSAGDEAFSRRFLELDANGYGDKVRLYETLRQEFRLRANVNELIEDFRCNCFKTAYLFPGARRVLSDLHGRGHRLAIVSNGSTASQMAKIEATGIEEWFDSILISGSLGVSKPDRRIFELAAESLGADPADCVFVGDNPERDIVGAARVGMRTVWISHGRQCPIELRVRPTFTVHSLAEMIEMPSCGA